MNSSPPQSRALPAAAHTLEIRFDGRQNRADIYVGNLLIGEAYTGGSNPSTQERAEWARIVRAVNSHDDLVAALERVKAEAVVGVANGSFWPQIREALDKARG